MSRHLNKQIVHPVLLFNKPYRVLSQFTSDDNHRTLADFIPIKNVYAAGRLDFDSEGLLILTDDGKLQSTISDPKHKMLKIYWVQVEGAVDEKSLAQLAKGVVITGGYQTKPCQVTIIGEPDNLWERMPPIRYRANISTTWLQIKISEGKNRQVRQMTAAIGHPTLRLIRYAIGNWTVDNLVPGEYRWSDHSCKILKNQ